MYEADILKDLGDPDKTTDERFQQLCDVHPSGLKPETSIYFSKTLQKKQVAAMQNWPWSEVTSLITDFATGKDSQESCSA
jgi:hypothetical protein